MKPKMDKGCKRKLDKGFARDLHNLKPDYEARKAGGTINRKNFRLKK